MVKTIAVTGILLCSMAAFAEGEGMPRTAFVFEARLAGSFSLSSVSSPVPVPALMLGARIVDRVHLGLSAAFAATNQGVVTANTSIFTIGPNVAVDIVKGAQNRVAFYGRGGLGFGGNLPAAGSSRFVLGFELGFGVRYAPVSMFAIGMEAGFSGSFIDPGRAGSFGITSIFAAVVGTFMYGK